MDIRPYEAERDLKAIQRIWREIGWIDSKDGEAAVADMLSTGRCLTAALDGEAECMAHTSLGAMRYQSHEDLSMCAVTAVMTSRIARQLGLALRITARQLAAGAEDGAALAVLGVFDQGFYDKLGFGTGSYEHTFRFDPATLRVDAPFRPPKRLTKDDWQAVHGAMMNRRRGHGGCLLPAAELMKAELAFRPKSFGFGYGSDSALTHCVWLVAEEMEHGPYQVQMLAYQDGPQLLELLALLKSLGDQVSLIEMHEPWDIQMQTLLKEPFRNRRNTRDSKYAAYHRTAAWWQARMLDVGACVAARHWPGEKVQFNLQLTDPVAEFLPDGPWQGCAGDYWVSVGPNSWVKPGHRDDLPTLQATVNAFSRLWFGVVPATGLAVTDGLKVEAPVRGSDFMASPAPLLDRLDEALCLPPPRTGWDF